MNVHLAEKAVDSSELTIAMALEQIAARAGDLDVNPRFPSENFASLKQAGVPQLAADLEHTNFAQEIAVIRRVAAADASTARILDGHLNGVERLALGAPHELRERELDGVRCGMLLGVWGADPAPADGSPAKITQTPNGGLALKGAKTFCSGAGGVQRALVIARDEAGARRLVYVDVTSAVEIDRTWYRASGLRASESHRVEFFDTPILATLGGEDEATREPWFARDAVRTAATWAGIADCIVQTTVATVGDGKLDDVRLHAVGRMRVAQASIDRWLEHAVFVLEDAGADREEEPDQANRDLVVSGTARALASECRVALAEGARIIAADAARVCGSRALIDGGALDRARRDLDLFLLQHRLDPKIVELGTRTLEEGLR